MNRERVGSKIPTHAVLLALKKFRHALTKIEMRFAIVTATTMATVMVAAKFVTQYTYECQREEMSDAEHRVLDCERCTEAKAH